MGSGCPCCPTGEAFCVTGGWDRRQRMLCSALCVFVFVLVAWVSGSTVLRVWLSTLGMAFQWVWCGVVRTPIAVVI